MDLRARLDFLSASQNADGGWGYFPGKHSWLEPTVYGALALAPGGKSADRVQRAWQLTRSWQNADGGWRPAAAVPASTWGTALAITLGDVLGKSEQEIGRGARWLLETSGAESSMLNRLLRFCNVAAVEREVKDAGWPWRPGTSAWVEPTAHSLVALKKLRHGRPDRKISNRIDSGERMLLEVRCPDGGWNYGSPRALGAGLPSYAETTALALVGLGGRAPASALEHARGLIHEEMPPLARAWLSIALRLSGAQGEIVPSAPTPDRDILLCAIEALDPALLLPGARI